MSGQRWRWELPLIAGAFLACYALPVAALPAPAALREGLLLVQDYARAHVLRCVLPALFIAGAIAALLRQEAVLACLGPRAPRPLAYGVASVSGALLAVCSCTVLPLFAGIWRAGAGLGPAIAFLYAGPAINVLALALTAQVLGWPLALARALASIILGVLVGLAMAALFRERGAQPAACAPAPSEDAAAGAAPPQAGAALAGILLAALVAMNWAPGPEGWTAWNALHAGRWWLAAAAGLVLAAILVRGFAVPWWQPALAAAAVAAAAGLVPQAPDLAVTLAAGSLALIAARGPAALRAWAAETWSLARQILPLLLLGVFATGVLLGRPGHSGVLPADWVAGVVGGDGLSAIAVAAVIGALLYLATLTEVPIVQGLMGCGMGAGPALALLLAGPALSLPAMLALRQLLGTRRALAYIALVVASSIAAGWGFARITA